jgi:hypothetical protein
VRQLLELADVDGRAGDLLAAADAHLAVVCVGPVCAAVAREEGFGSPLIPEHWRLGSMVNLVGEVLAARRVERRVGDSTVVVQGDRVEVDGVAVAVPVSVPVGVAVAGPHPPLGALARPVRRALAVLAAAHGNPVADEILGEAAVIALRSLGSEESVGSLGTIPSGLVERTVDGWRFGGRPIG